MGTPQLTFRRRETKYLLSEGQRVALEGLAAIHMAPDAHGAATVRSVYYDTPTYLLARRSAEHPTYKEKLRTRAYGSPHPFDSVFVELKKKCDGVVYKRRCRLSPTEACELLAGRGRPTTQVEREIDWAARSYEGLRPAMLVAYERQAWVCEDGRDLRLTFDRSIRARWENVVLAGDARGRALIGPGQSLLEVKSMYAMPLWLVGFLSAEKIRKASFSKYGGAFRLMAAECGLDLAPCVTDEHSRARHLRRGAELDAALQPSLS